MRDVWKVTEIKPVGMCYVPYLKAEVSPRNGTKKISTRPKPKTHSSRGSKYRTLRGNRYYSDGVLRAFAVRSRPGEKIILP